MNEEEMLPAIPEEEPTRQEIIPFLGDDLAAAMTTRGNIYVTLPGMCAALGLKTGSQVDRIRRTKTLDNGLRMIPLPTRGGVQKITCLRIDKVALWLAGIRTTAVKPQFREKIEQYQEELAPIATQVFLRVMGLTPVQPSQPLAAEFSALMDLVLDLREQMAGVPGQITDLSGRMDTAIALGEWIRQLLY